MDKKSNNPFMDTDWISLQQQYAEALASLAPGARTPSAPGTAEAAWNEALDRWWGAVSGSLPDEHRPVYDTLLQQFRMFYAIGDQFTQMLKDMADTGNGGWEATMSAHFGRMKSLFDRAAGSADRQSTAAFIWPLPFEAWKQGLDAARPPVPGLAGAKSPAALYERLLSMPGIGPTRNIQDKLRESLRLWNDYLQKSAAYFEAFRDVGKLSLDALEEKIRERARTGRKITSLREIYDLWVDANEEVFAEFAFNEDYLRLYGDLINSLMAFRRHAGGMLDDVLGAASLPTVRETRTTQARQQRMRGELREAVASQRRTADELAALRRELAELKSSKSPAKKKAASRTPAGAGGKRKTATKTAPGGGKKKGR